MLYPILTYSRNLGDFPYDLAELHEQGLKAIRLIYKGKTEEEFNERILEIQQKITENGLDIDILVDLPGKKPIVSGLGKGLDVESGEIYHLVNSGRASAHHIPTLSFFDHENFPDLCPGDVISIADDELNLLIQEVLETAVSCVALNSYHLTSFRSMGLKNKAFDITANSEVDLQFVKNIKDVQSNVKLVVSFVRKAAEILTVKALQPEIEVIPKIETIIHKNDLQEILDCSDTIMLGRGDLSLVCKPNELFRFQQLLIDLCSTQNKKLIIGTGLLTSLSDKQSPAISEITDYGYLRHQGIEAFLISGSNALKYPFETLKFMREFDS